MTKSFFRQFMDLFRLDRRKSSCQPIKLEALERRVLLSAVVGHELFYNDSAFDQNDPAINAADDAAIATDKQALRELDKATFNNYSSYDKGINGLMVDIDHLTAAPTLDSFVFRSGNAQTDPFGWSLAAAPTDWQVRWGQGENGSDRIVFTWDSTSAVKGQWLQVTVLPTTQTGLYKEDVFYFGSAIGETGNEEGSTRVNATDMLEVRDHPQSLLDPALITNPYDFNRDRKVNATDMLIARDHVTNYQTDLNLITAPINPVDGVQAELFSSSEMRLTWRDQSDVETGYKIIGIPQANTQQMSAMVLAHDAVAKSSLSQLMGDQAGPGGIETPAIEMEVPADATAALITGLSPTTTYHFQVVPMGGPEMSQEVLPTLASVAQVTTTAQTSGSQWYQVSLPSTAMSRNEAGYTGSGSATVVYPVVQANSAGAAIFMAISGSGTVINHSNEPRTYSVDTSGAYKAGTAAGLESSITETKGNGFNRPAGVGDDQWLLVLEDTYEWTNVDLDYDDFYWKVDVTPVSPDLTVADLADADEETVGGYIVLNDDYDELNADPNGNPVADNHPDTVAGDRIDATDSDLHDASLALPETTGQWTLTFPGTLRLWQKISPNQYVPIVSGVSYDKTSSTAQTIQLKIEGIDLSAARNDSEIAAVFHPSADPFVAATDTAAVTVVGVDLDVDSDNNNQYDLPSSSFAEEAIEDDSTLPGKILYTNDGERPALSLLAQLPQADLAGAKFQISYSTATVKLWRSATSQNPTDYLAPGEYTGSQLGLAAGAADLTLYMEGVDLTTDEASRLISVEMDPDGSTGPAGYIARDDVYVTVQDGSTRPGIIQGFKWNDLNGNGIRDGGLVTSPPDTVFVIDVSGSTLNAYRGGSVGDVNQDGYSNTILDGEIQAFINLNQYLIDQDYGYTNVGVVAFDTSAVNLDLDPTTPGTQIIAHPGSSVEAALRGLQIRGSTNYHDGLQQAINTAREMLSSQRSTNIFFLSDGYPNVPNTSVSAYISQVDTLRGSTFNANLRAFGAGTEASLYHLQQIDPNAVIFVNSQPLLDAFSGSVGGVQTYSEPGIAGWHITAFVDANSNGQLDTGETSYTAVTAQDGTYTLHVPVGTYIVQEESQSGWTQTAPGTQDYTVQVTGGAVVSANFGNLFTPAVDLDIDSDNNNGSNAPDRNSSEDDIEDDANRPGKILNVGGDEARVVLDLSQFDDITAATIRFTYSGVDPADSSGTHGHLRLWTTDGSQPRSANEYITPGQSYGAAELGLTASNKTITLWAEGVIPTQNIADRLIRTDVDLDGSGPLAVDLHDSVYVTVKGLPPGNGSVSGYAFHDRNRNAFWDKNIVVGTQPDVLFILDISGSTQNPFAGTPVGNLNHDGWENSILDAEIAGYTALNQQLIDLGYGTTANVSIVAFDDGVYVKDLNPASGDQGLWSTHPSTDRDGNGAPDIVDILTQLPVSGNTAFQPPLQKAIDLFRQFHTLAGNANVFFLSDGDGSGGFSSQIATLKGPEFLANVRAFGVGEGANLNLLKQMDPQAARFTSTDEILNVFSGPGAGESPEEGLSDWLVYVDLNKNGEHDTGEPSAITDTDGYYSITNLPAGTYTIAEEAQTNWLLTAPQGGTYQVDVGGSAALQDINFGNVEDVPPPEASLTTAGAVDERTPASVSFKGPEGEGSPTGTGPFRYSYDFNNDGDFGDPGDIYRSASPSASFTPDDGPHTYTVHGRIHDAVGQYQDYTVDVTVNNVAPSVTIVGAPDEVDLTNDTPTILLTGSVSDPSDADSKGSFTYSWLVTKDGDPFDSGTDANYSFAPDGIGAYVITFAATDKDGGTGSTSKTITVKSSAPYIVSGPTATSTEVDGKDVELSIVANDDGGEENLSYAWQKTSGPADVAFLRNGTHDSSTTQATFEAVGTYAFIATVLDADGYTVDSQTLTVNVNSTVTQVLVSPSVASVEPNQSKQFSATALNQFGASFTPTNPITWSLTTSTSGGNVSSSGNYTAGSTLGGDVIQAAVGTVAGTAAIEVQNSTDTQIVGAASTGFSAIEGTEASDLPLAGFFDPVSGTSAGDYTATIDWDDGQSPTTGVVSAYTLPDSTPAYQVSGSHTYESEGTYNFTVTFTHTATSRYLQVSGTIVVVSAQLTAQLVQFTPVVDQPVTTPIARFIDANQFTDVGDFSASIDWGDGHSSSGQIVDQGDGQYDIVGAHTYSNTGDQSLTVTLYEDSQQRLVLSGNTLVTLAAVPVPAGLTAVGISSSQIYLYWDEDPNADGYIIWATQTDTGARRRIPGDSSQIISPQLAPSPENPPPTGETRRLARWDQNLPTDTEYSYAIQAVYADGSVSPLSDSVTASTWSTVNVPAPTGLTATEVTTTDSTTGVASQAVQLFWDPSEVDGYKVFRRETGQDDNSWQDLVGEDSYIGPDLINDNGKIGWLDKTVDFDSVGSYDYKVIAYKSDSGQENAVASDPVIVTVTEDTTPPSVPQHLRAASYPQAIQLTWDDRPVEDDNDFSGWNVYRYNSDQDAWIKLNLRPIAEETGFNDFTAPVDQESSYHITAVDLFGNESDPSDEVSHRRSIHAEPPTPTGLFGRPNGSGNIDLDWDDIVPIQDQGHAGDQLKGYRVERQDSPAGSWTLLIDADQLTDSEFSDSGLNLSAQYRYRVSTVDQDGDVSAPAEVTVSTGDGVAPATPEIVSVGTNGPTSIQLEWEAGSGSGDATTGFRVYRSTSDDEGFSLVGEYAVDSPTNVLIDKNLASSTTYYYRVYAVDADGDISAAATDHASTQTVADQPPFVSLTTPAAGGSPLVVSADMKVRGIIDDPNNDLSAWQLVLRPLSQTGPANDLILVSGTQEMGQKGGADAALGAIQPTLLPDGLYQLVLKAQDQNDGTNQTIGSLIQIKTDVKVGNFTLPVVDLQVDVPGADPITVGRIYDSSKADINGDFGYGWSLDLVDTQLRTTARAGSHGDETMPAMRNGDLVYITIPGRGQQVFQFLPQPTNYDPGNPGGAFGAYFNYKPVFVAVDGSASVLTVADDDGQPFELIRDGDEFYSDTSNGRLGYNPARSIFGQEYQLTTSDHTQYIINAATGDLISSTDANGNITTYKNGTVGVNGHSVTVHHDPDHAGRVDWISIDPSGKAWKILYNYDPTTGDLLSVTDQRTDTTTYYHYDDSAHAHYLTGVTDPRGVDTIAVSYDKSGKVAAVTDAAGQSAPTNYSGFDGQSGSSGVTDLSGNATEQIYDSRGGVIRQIQAIKDDTGAVVRYVVTVSDYRYVEDSLVDPLEYGVTGYNKLFSQTQWQPFVIEGADAAGLRYTASPTDMGAHKAHAVEYKLIDPGDPDPDDADLWMPRYETTWAADGTPLKTEYKDYVNGKPGTIIDPWGNTTTNTYDSAGNLTGATNAIGETTYYTYTDGGNYTYTNGAVVNYSGLSKGLLLESYRVRDGGSQSNPADRIVLSSNVYYAAESSGRDYGRLKSVTDASGVTTEYIYTNDGQVQTIFRTQGDPDAGSEHITIESDPIIGGLQSFYDAQGRLIRSTTFGWNSSGYGTAELRTVYDGQGRPAWVTDEYFVIDNGSGAIDNATRAPATHIVYDDNGQVIARYRYADVLIRIEDDPSHAGSKMSVRDTTQDQDGLPAQRLYSSVRRSYNEYDAAGRLVRSADAYGQTTSTAYDALGQVDATTDPFGGVTRNTYDLKGNLIRTLYPDGTETRSAYDAMGRVIWSSDRFASDSSYDSGTDTWDNDNTSTYIVTHMIYDSLGRVVGTERYKEGKITLGADAQYSSLLAATAPDASALAVAGDLLSTTSTVYNDQGRMAETVDASGLRTGTLYYANGQVHYSGPLEASAPADWYTQGSPLANFQSYTTYAYDQTDSLPTGAISYDSVTDALGNTTKRYKDALGRVIRTTYADDTFTQTLYGVNGLPVTDHEVTGQTIDGQQVTKIDQAGHATDYFYDLSGNLTDVYQPAVDDATTPETTLVRPHWHYSYDADGNETSQSDPKGDVTTFTYDALGNRLSRTLPEGQAGGSLEDQQTEYWTYDDMGRVLTHTDFKGQTTKYIYDDSATAGGRLIEEDRFTGADDGTPDEHTTYGYDDLGRQDEVKDYEDSTLIRTESSTYDAITGQMAAYTTPEGTIHYVYDPATGRHIETYTDDTDTSYVYNDLGQLWKVHVTKLNGQTVDLTTTYTYDLVGNLATQADPNDVVTTYTYDDLNRLTDELVTQGANSVFSQHYTLDDDGQRDEVIEKRFDVNGDVFSKVKTTWTYDALNRLLGETRDGDPTPADGQDNFDTQEGDDYTDTFTFDLAGNRFTKSHDAVGTANDSTTIYAYNGNDQLTAEGPDTDADGVPDSATATTYGYDLNGSQIQVIHDGQTDVYVYNLHNKMVSVTKGGAETGYAYDEAGNRVQETTGGVTTDYLTDTNNPTGYAQPIEEKVSGAVTRTYILGNRVLAQADANGVVTYLMTDGHGSTRALIDATGAVTTTLDYDAFGGAIGFDPATIGTEFQYAGDAIYDSATGLYLHGDGTRPRMGYRFIQADPRFAGPGDLGNANLYVFVGNNAPNEIDPTGHEGVIELGLVSSIALDLMAIGTLNTIGVGLYNFIGGAFLSRGASGFGGPDITTELKGINQYLTGYVVDHGSLPDLEWSRTFEEEQWDIRQLANWGKPGNINAPGRVTDGFDTFSTVTVNHHVYRPEEVNYYLYGTWFRLNGYSETYGEERIIAYRTFFGPDNGSILGRTDWFRAGYYNNFSLAQGAAIAGVAAGHPYDGRMYFQIQGQATGTVLPNGSVIGGVDATMQ